VHLYHGKGCDACGGTGYRGRVGIYELLEVTPAIRELIVARASSADLNAAAVKEGMITMFDDGFAKVMTGMTTVEELLRVAAPPIVPHDKKHIQE
jgi:type IV pilus assembly protein PilB